MIRGACAQFPTGLNACLQVHMLLPAAPERGLTPQAVPARQDGRTMYDGMLYDPPDSPNPS